MRILFSPDDIEEIEFESGDFSVGGTYVYSHIITSIVAGQKLVLHRPSFGKLQAVANAGKSILTPANVVELVNRGFVSIAAREPWFDKSRRSNDRIWGSNYPVTKLDEVLIEMYKEDDAKPIRERRVFALTDPNRASSSIREVREEARIARGREYSDEVSRSEPDLYEYARGLLRSSALPRGLLERARKPDTKNLGEDAQVRVVIQDAHNNCNLVEETESDIPFRPGDYFDGIDFLAGRSANAIPGNIDQDFDFVELFGLLSALRPFNSFDEFIGFLQRRDRTVVANGIQQLLLRNSEGVAAQLVQDVGAERGRVENDNFSISTFLLGLLDALRYYGENDENILGSGLQFVRSNIENLRIQLERLNLIRRKAGNLEWVSMLVFANKRMTLSRRP